MTLLTDEQLQRYKRNVLLKEIGVTGQGQLLSSSVLIIGLGGIGSPVSLYLAAAGVGTVGLVDYDSVDLSNLQRQIIHSTNDIGRKKVHSAKESINNLNPAINVLTYDDRYSPDKLLSVIKEFDFIIDATDNFPAKFLINDLCASSGKAFSHGGVTEFAGQTMTVVPGQSACYRCVFGGIPSEDAVAPASSMGVMGAVVGILGSIQATEAIKYITQCGDNLINTLLTFDAKNMEFRKVALKKQKLCSACSTPAV